MPATDHRPRLRALAATICSLRLAAVGIVVLLGLSSTALALQGPCGVRVLATPSNSGTRAADIDSHRFVASQVLTALGPAVEIHARDAVTGAFTLEQALHSPSGPTAFFGAGLDLDRERLAVSDAPSNGVLIYRHDPAGWVLEQALAAIPVPSVERVGVKLWGDLLLATSTSGVEAWERDPVSGLWAFADLIAPGPLGQATFGRDIDFDGRVLVVSDFLAERVAIHRRDPQGSWFWLQDLTPPTPTNPGFGRFGAQVEIEDLVIAVGQDASQRTTAVDVFRYVPSGNIWSLAQRLDNPVNPGHVPHTATHHFGTGLAMSGGRLAVSAPSVTALGGTRGELHLYKQHPFNYLFRPELVLTGGAPAPVPGWNLGWSIALEGGLLATSREPSQSSHPLAETYVLVPGTTDCDLDGQPDACQILLGQRNDDNRNGFVDECELSGVRYCAPAVPNSAGTAARMNVFGPARVLLFYLELFVSGLPPGAPGYVLMAQSSQIVANPGVWLGNLCVAGGPIARGLGGVQVADRDGGFWFWQNRPVVPMAMGLAPILPGQTWNFQCWYLDAALVPRSNFSDAIAVTFTLL